MNRDDVIHMAREAGIEVDWSFDFQMRLERFAALVEADFKHRLAGGIEKMPFGDTAASFATFVREFK